MLELASLRDPTTDNRVGPIYPRGKRIEGLNLATPLENANSQTFEVLKPKRRADYDPDASRRYPLTKLPDDKKEFTLVESEKEVLPLDPPAPPESEREGHRRPVLVGIPSAIVPQTPNKTT